MIAVDVQDAEVLLAVTRLERGTAEAGVLRFLRVGALRYLQKRVDKRFAQEGDDASGPWVPLRYTTALIRASMGYPAWHPINRRSGDLKDFVRSSYRLNQSGAYTLTMPGRVPSGRLGEKYRTAQLGGGKKSASRFIGPRHPAPPRPVLALGVRDQLELETNLLAWVREGGVMP